EQPIFRPAAKSQAGRADPGPGEPGLSAVRYRYRLLTLVFLTRRSSRPRLWRHIARFHLACLTITSDDNGTASSVTGKHHARQKREALEKLANEIKRIVGNLAELHYADAAICRASCSAVRILLWSMSLPSIAFAPSLRRIMAWASLRISRSFTI